MKQLLRTELLVAFCALTMAASASQAETITAITSGDRLLVFDSASPGTIIRAVNISGLRGHLAAIDFRPATGDLYGLGSPSCVTPSQCTADMYTINYVTGAATNIGTVFNVFVVPPAPPSSFDIDFDSTTDRIRYTDNRGNNLRLPNSGSSFPTRDNSLAYAAGDTHAGATPNVVGSAYTNNFVGAATTVLYDIDSALDTLVYQDPQNAGQLHTVGNLGVDTAENVGFDISQGTGTAYASLRVGGAVGLYTINLASGAATLVGTIGDATSLAGEIVVDIAVPTATRLLNISTRGRVGTGDDVLIGGFINRGGGRILLRAIGPSLSAFGVASPLPDPVLTLKDSNGATLATNDDWQSSQAAEINATGLAPSDSAESAILTSLPAGNYSGVVSGKGSATGIAVVEVFQLP